MDTRALEKDLVARAQEGSQQAFTELIRMHKDSVFGVCRSMSSNPHDAEDAYSIAVSSAYKYLDRFRGGSSFKTWLIKIALNASKKQGQQTQRRQEFVQLDADAGVNMFAGGSDLGARVAVADQVHTARRKMNPDFWEVLVLREIGGYTYAEIASKQHIPVATVKSRLNRARKQLKELLKEE